MDEQEQIENPYATLNGKIATVAWEQISVGGNTNGEDKEDIISSRLTKYDGENHPIELTEHSRGETRVSYSYENGLLKATRGRTFGADGKPASEEFWEILQYDSGGHLVEFNKDYAFSLFYDNASAIDDAGLKFTGERGDAISGVDWCRMRPPERCFGIGNGSADAFPLEQYTAIDPGNTITAHFQLTMDASSPLGQAARRGKNVSLAVKYGYRRAKEADMQKDAHASKAEKPRPVPRGNLSFPPAPVTQK